MTDAEFLDDVERRGINGSVFKGEEVSRLMQLAGHPDVVPNCDIFMRAGARRYVRKARARLHKLVVDRLKGEPDALLSGKTIHQRAQQKQYQYQQDMKKWLNS